MDAQGSTGGMLLLARTSFERALKDWGIQIGFDSTVEEGATVEAQDADSGEFSWSGQRYVRITTRIERAAQGTTEFFFPLDVARHLVELILGEVESGPEEALSNEELEVFAEMANLFCGSVNAVYDQYGLRLSQDVEHLKVEQGGKGLPSDLEGRLSRFPYRAPGFPLREIMQLTPRALSDQLNGLVRAHPAIGKAP